MNEQRTWFDPDWKSPGDADARNARVFSIIPYPAEVEGFTVQEWHQQRADCFVSHLIDDLKADGARIPARLNAAIARRVGYAIAEAAALENARILILMNGPGGHK